ncbi:MAG: GNAT family N-acetyltransferase [Ignavibacteriae bacterium]|nr:GNAT family N-acetyltransferase [Ignavibacteriota bacterium]
MENNHNLLAKITIKSNRKLLLSVLSFIKQIAIDFGFDKGDADKLMLVTDEACLNVIKYAFIDEQDMCFDIIVEKRNGQFVIGVEDKGLPFDFDSEEKDKTKGFGMTIMKEYTDEIKFVNLGQNGKRIELIKQFPNKSLEKFFSEELENKEDAPRTDILEIQIEIRPMKSEEYYKLERLVYKTYKYTYSGDFVYYPERTKELIENDMLISTVAVTSKGEFAGHIAVEKFHKDSQIAELGMLMVDPIFRERHLGELLVEESIQNAKNKGLLGLYSEAVTIHEYSQKAVIKTGGKETGIMLGYIHKEQSFRKIKEEQLARQSAVLFYTRLNTEPERFVYLPQEHSAIIKKIYSYGNFKRTYKKSNPDALESDKQTIFNVAINQVKNVAHLDIVSYGNDIEKALKIHLRELLLHKIDVIYLNVPLSNPYAQHFNKLIESNGFIFCGIVPEYKDGDILRYQYLNNIDLKPESTVIVSDMGKELFDYVIKYYR